MCKGHDKRKREKWRKLNDKARKHNMKKIWGRLGETGGERGQEVEKRETIETDI